jgi:hypothetical protein
LRCWRDIGERTNKAVTRLRVGGFAMPVDVGKRTNKAVTRHGFAVPAIIRNGSLRANVVILRKFEMKILQPSQ